VQSFFALWAGLWSQKGMPWVYHFENKVMCETYNLGQGVGQARIPSMVVVRSSLEKGFGRKWNSGLSFVAGSASMFDE